MNKEILRIGDVTITKIKDEGIIFHLPEGMNGFKFEEFKRLHYQQIQELRK